MTRCRQFCLHTIPLITTKCRISRHKASESLRAVLLKIWSYRLTRLFKRLQKHRKPMKISKIWTSCRGFSQFSVKESISRIKNIFSTLYRTGLDAIWCVFSVFSKTGDLHTHGVNYSQRILLLSSDSCLADFTSRWLLSKIGVLVKSLRRRLLQASSALESQTTASSHQKG